VDKLDQDEPDYGGVQDDGRVLRRACAWGWLMGGAGGR
jgi:hypothetical protein